MQRLDDDLQHLHERLENSYTMLQTLRLQMARVKLQLLLYGVVGFVAAILVVTLLYAAVYLALYHFC